MKQFNLEEYLSNPERKVITRDGRSARIICTDRKELNFPIVALIEKECGEQTRYYTKDGKVYMTGSHDSDLYFASEKHEGWVNVYRDMGDSWEYCGRIYDSEEEAKVKANNPLATIKIEWEEE